MAFSSGQILEATTASDHSHICCTISSERWLLPECAASWRGIGPPGEKGMESGRDLAFFGSLVTGICSVFTEWLPLGLWVRAHWKKCFHLPNGESSLSPLERNATVKQVCLRLLMFFGRSTSNWECLTSCWILACCKRYNPSCKKEDTGFQIIFDAVWNQSSTSPNHSSPSSSLTLFHALSFSRYPKLLTAGWRNWNANQSSAVLKFSANWLFFSGATDMDICDTQCCCWKDRRKWYT